MHRVLSILVVAILAITAMAAPAPSRTLSKRSFAAKVKGHKKLSGAEALQRAARKYGFEVNFPETDVNARRWEFGESFSHHHHGADPNFPSESELAQLISSIEASSPSAVPSGFGGGSSSFAVVPSGSAVPSGFASSSAVASSGAPPAQSSAPSASAPAPAPSSSSSPGSGSESGSVSADPEANQALYLSPVTIGGQQVNLDFDTGSSDLWVFDTQSSGTSGHAGFDPSKSQSFKAYQGGSWQIQYGDGSMASGTVGFDTVTIGGVTAPKQAVELAQKVSSTFVQDASSDGLLGLAFSSINQVRPQPQKTFWENIMGDLEQPLFTANLEKDNSGTYEFGKIDTTKFSGNLNYADVDNSQGFWMLQSGPFSVGGAQQACTGCDPFIVDTGTSLLIMDDAIVEAYYKQVQGAQNSATFQGWVYPCTTTPPDFGVSIGSYMAVIKGADMTYMQAGSGMCYGGMQAGGSQAQINILGDVFLKQFFAVFDGGNLRLGVAPKA